MTEIKRRNVAAVVILSIVTCGVYAIYWQVCLIDGVNKAKEDESTKSGIVVFLLNIVTYSIYWLYWVSKAGECIGSAKTANGTPALSCGLVYPLLSIFGLGIVAIAILQNNLNSLAVENYDGFEM